MLGRITLGLVVIAMVVAAAAIWLLGERVLASRLAAQDEWNAIRQNEAVLGAGPQRTDWPLRAFLPAALLQSASANLKGAELDVPIGEAKDGHVDGFIHFLIRSAQLVPGDGRLGVALDTAVSYRADRVDPWWGGATAKVQVQAVMLPARQKVSGGVRTTEFRIVPDSIALAAGAENFDVRIIAGLARALAANEVAIHLRDALVLAVPGLNPAFDLDPSVDSRSFQPFGGTNVKNPGTTIIVTMPGTPKTLQARFDQWLLTKSGLWVLGGKEITAPVPENAPAPAEIEQHRQALASKLTPFQRKDSMVELTVPGKTLTDFIDTVLTPGPLKLTVATSGTNGNITDAIVLHNDKVLGDVGLEVRPRGDAFGRGTIKVTPGVARWDGKSGVSLPLSVKADAKVALDVHLATGIGGGIGANVDLAGDAAVPGATLNASFERRAVAEGSAILLQPSLPCTPMTLDVHPGEAPIAQDWIQVDPVGFRLERELGGMKIAPAVLVDSLPLFSKLPAKKDVTPPADVAKPKFSFARPYLVMTFVPDSVSIDEAGVTVRAGAQLATRDSAETDAEKNARNALRHALKGASPEVTCKALTGLKLVGGGTTIVDLYRELAFIGQSLKNHVEVAKRVLDAATDLDPRNTPENLKKLADAIGKAVADDAKHVWETVTNPPEPEAKVGDVKVKATPLGPEVKGKVGGTEVEVKPGGVKVGDFCLGIRC